MVDWVHMPMWMHYNRSENYKTNKDKTIRSKHHIDANKAYAIYEYRFISIWLKHVMCAQKGVKKWAYTPYMCVFIIHLFSLFMT